MIGRTPRSRSRARRPSVPAPPIRPQAARRQALPQHRIPQRTHAERRDAIQVLDASVVTGPRHLVEPAIADPVDGALDAAPHLEGRLAGVHAAFTISRREIPAIFAYKVNACATTWSML